MSQKPIFEKVFPNHKEKMDSTQQEISQGSTNQVNIDDLGRSHNLDFDGNFEGVMMFDSQKFCDKTITANFQISSSIRFIMISIILWNE